MATTVSAEGYLGALTPILQQVSGQATDAVQRAADLVVSSLRANGVAQACGTGHSEALATEIAGRAGGLSRVHSRHSSGTKLAGHADVVLDNGAPYGHAVVALPDEGMACAVSSITAALLAQMVLAGVIGRLIAAGATPPVFLSANYPGGDDHNAALEHRYAGRIRRTA